MVLLRVFHGSKQELEVIAGLLALGGQAAVWVAMDGLRRTQGWASGVLFYLFAGGLLTSMMVYLTGIPLLMLVPWVAPLTALVAKKRMLHRNHAAGEVR